MYFIFELARSHILHPIADILRYFSCVVTITTMTKTTICTCTVYTRLFWLYRYGVLKEYRLIYRENTTYQVLMHWPLSYGSTMTSEILLSCVPNRKFDMRESSVVSVSQINAFSTSGSISTIRTRVRSTTARTSIDNNTLTWRQLDVHLSIGRLPIIFNFCQTYHRSPCVSGVKW